ncbi:MAG: VWA domain-containing protein, partial [Planctomycetales bacterium]|nr:VWA domain-containing protein [Planctomycetales bacterium]
PRVLVREVHRVNSLLAQLDQIPTDEVWRLQTHWTLAPWLSVLLVSGAIALVAYCYFRERSPAGAAYRTVLGLLRLVTIALILVMLSELLLAGSRTGRSRFAWLVDLSGSMGISDASPGSDLSRIDQVKAALLADNSRLLKSVADEYDTKMVTVAKEPRTLEGGLAEWPAEIEQFSADDAALTRLGDAVSNLVQQASQPAPQGIVVWTDGRNTAGQSLSAAAEAARRAGTRLFFVGVGSDKSPPDVVLSDALADEVVFVEDLLALGATLRVKGSVEAPIKLTLRREGDGAVLAEQTIEPQQALEAMPVQLLHRPTEPGDYRYVLEAAPVDGERDTDNNSVSFDVQVRKAGQQTWIDWQTDRPAGQATFVVDPCLGQQTMEFRVRARSEQPPGSGGAWPNHRYPGDWSAPSSVTFQGSIACQPAAFLPLVSIR